MGMVMWEGGRGLLSTDGGEALQWQCWERNFQETQQKQSTNNKSKMNHTRLISYINQSTQIEEGSQNEFQRGFQKEKQDMNASATYKNLKTEFGKQVGIQA